MSEKELQIKTYTGAVCVIIPAFNEEIHIKNTLMGIPKFVRRIIVVNDGSTDLTEQIIQECIKRDSRISLVTHNQNMGLGNSLISGYLESLSLGVDVIAVMAGDNQMDPNDLWAVVSPVVNGKVDYVKGNRLLRGDVRKIMPGYRYFGNSLLTFLTKFATGYWHVIDPQCGYTAISSEALRRIPISELTPGYGYNAQILNMLNIAEMRVCDVEVRPVYGPNTSKIQLWKYIPVIMGLLTKLFTKRILQKYLWRDFHPLVLFYFLSLFNGVLVALPLGIRVFYYYFLLGVAPTTTLILTSLAINISILSLFFAIWMDMEGNKHLCLTVSWKSVKQLWMILVVLQETVSMVLPIGMVSPLM